MLDNDVPHLVGNSMDEFMRHHPGTKERVMKSIFGMVEGVIGVCESIEPEIGEGCSLVRQVVGSKDIERVDSKVSQFVETMSRVFIIN